MLRPAAVCREKNMRKEGFAAAFLNRTAFGCLLGLGCDPFLFGLSFRDLSVLHLPQDVKALRRDSRNDAHGKRNLGHPPFSTCTFIGQFHV